MNIEEKIKLVVKDTEEIITREELINLLNSKPTPTSYWGVAPTGPPHIGYYRAVAKQIDIVNAGFKHKILIANLHAYLDDMKSPWEEIDIRGEVYRKCFELLGLKGNNIEYVMGTEFQLTKEYYLETLKASAMVTVNRSLRAASEVVRMKNPKVSSLIYPIMQSLDCWGLDVDLAYAGIDNRHVYMLSSELLHKLGHNVPVFVFTPLGISLSGGEKMSASEKATRLELFANPDDIRSKITKAYCPYKIVEGNPILEYCKYLIFPRVNKFVIERQEKFGGDISFENFENLKKEFEGGNIHPLDLKKSAAKYLIEILKPIRDYFEKNKDMIKIFENNGK